MLEDVGSMETIFDRGDFVFYNSPTFSGQSDAFLGIQEHKSTQNYVIFKIAVELRKIVQKGTQDRAQLQMFTPNYLNCPIIVRSGIRLN